MTHTFSGPFYRFISMTAARRLCCGVVSPRVRRVGAIGFLSLAAIGFSGCNFLQSLTIGPSIETKQVANAVVGVPYSFKIEATGADFAYWDSSKMPPGLSFDDGRIKGTPTLGGTFQIAVAVFDDSGKYIKSDSRSYTMLILDITTTTLPSGTAEQVYAPFSLSAVGTVGTPAWILSGGALPEGMSFSNAGILDGMPAVAGNFQFTASVADQDTPPRSKERPFSLSVVPNPNPALAVAFERVSVDSSGVEGNGPSSAPAISENGRFVAFESEADNLISHDENGVVDIFLRDTCWTATANCHPSTVRVSAAMNGGDANGASEHATISGNGRFVVFDSLATNLVAMDGNQASDVFLRDTCYGVPSGCQPFTEKISTTAKGTDANGASRDPVISADGRFVAFVSAATNLSDRPLTAREGVLMRDTCRGASSGCKPTVSAIELTDETVTPPVVSSELSLSGNGRYIVFASEVGTKAGGRLKVVVLHDSCFGAEPQCALKTEIVSKDQNGALANGDSFQPMISADGRVVVFSSKATNLAGNVGPPNGRVRTFVRNICGQDSECSASVQMGPEASTTETNESRNPTISRDGRYIAFESNREVAAGSTAGKEVLVKDRCVGAYECEPKTQRITRLLQGDDMDNVGVTPVLSGDGQSVAFVSQSANLVDNDFNHALDVFVSHPKAPVPWLIVLK